MPDVTDALHRGMVNACIKNKLLLLAGFNVFAFQLKPRISLYIPHLVAATVAIQEGTCVQDTRTSDALWHLHLQTFDARECVSTHIYWTDVCA